MAKKQLTLRIDPQLKDRLHEAALCEDRTVSSQVERLIRLWLDEHYPESATEKQPSEPTTNPTLTPKK